QQLISRDAKKLIGTVYIDDKSQIVMNVENLEAPLQDISSVIGNNIEKTRANQRKMALNMFNKPISDIEENKYLKNIYRGRK
ncbi:MAG: hypothetical protein IJX34_00200, partial [Clostridia bacterium]|nr:hypothetical protein [Clostridia bacterium]